ncbi:BTB/POZ domain-containing protein At4g08455-like [Rutidosis leptorrhynchoides]|uniref:BTB/POZ domain-containing protein At4g08455-like n=1 Tax=Rutidosis leptorrhynchoides TaxID=125765 RepID=UPI003A996458
MEKVSKAVRNQKAKEEEICKAAEEIKTNLFKSKSVLYVPDEVTETDKWWNLTWILPGSIEAFSFDWFYGMGIKASKFLKLIGPATIWAIWMARNDLLFNGIFMCRSVLVRNIKLKSFLWATNLKLCNGFQSYVWEHHYYKNQEKKPVLRGIETGLKTETMRCVSCGKHYYIDYDSDHDSDYYSDSDDENAPTCRACFEKACKTENKKLKRENVELKSKVSFLKFWDPLDTRTQYVHRPIDPCFTDVVLVAVDLDSGKPFADSVPVPANKAILASRSPVFRAMLETEMEESRSGTIKLSDVSHNVLCAFVKFLYIAETPLDDDMACDLIIFADKYQVKHLKTYCETFLIEKLNWENSLKNYSFAHQHNAKILLDAALSMIFDNMDKLSKQEGYLKILEKDHRLVMDIYEAYVSKRVNVVATTSHGDKIT